MPEALKPSAICTDLRREALFGFSLIDFMVSIVPFVMSGSNETRSF